MQQMIYLESNDILIMKGGQTLQLNVGGTTLMLGYMGKTYRKNGKAKDEAFDELPLKKRVRQPWNKGMKMKVQRKKEPCEVCGRKIVAQGMAPHMAMHRRKHEVAA